MMGGKKRGRGTRPKGGSGSDAAGGILHEMGKMLGIGGLLKKVENLPAIKERLEEVDEEIRRRLSEEDISGHGKRDGVLGAGRRGVPIGRPVVKGPQRRESEPDIFDEGDYLLVVAETPGMEEGDFTISLDGGLLTIGAGKAGRNYSKTLRLPCAPVGEMAKTYKNGILEIRINKQKAGHGN